MFLDCLAPKNSILLQQQPEYYNATEATAAASSSSASFSATETGGGGTGIQYVWNEHVMLRFPVAPGLNHINVHGTCGYDCSGMNAHM
jgi:hypothetical protein